MLVNIQFGSCWHFLKLAIGGRVMLLVIVMLLVVESCCQWLSHAIAGSVIASSDRVM